MLDKIPELLESFPRLCKLLGVELPDDKILRALVFYEFMIMLRDESMQILDSTPSPSGTKR